MSGFTEPTQLPTSVKPEIKEEEFDSREYDDFDSSPTSKLLVYCYVLCIYIQYLYFREWLTCASQYETY